VIVFFVVVCAVGDDGVVNMFLLDRDDLGLSADSEPIQLRTHQASVTGLALNGSQTDVFSCASDGGYIT